MLHRSTFYGIVGSAVIIAAMAAAIASHKVPDSHRPQLAFSASAEFARLEYREIKSPTLFNLLKDENWPEDLRRYRDLLGPNAGVPLWLVIADQQVIQRGMGPSQWHSDVLPKINKLLR